MAGSTRTRQRAGKGAKAKQPEAPPVPEPVREVIERLHTRIEKGKVVFVGEIDRTFSVGGCKHIYYPDRKYDEDMECWHDHSVVLRHLEKSNGEWYWEAIRADKLLSHLMTRHPGVFAELYDHWMSCPVHEQGRMSHEEVVRRQMEAVNRFAKQARRANGDPRFTQTDEEKREVEEYLDGEEQ